LRILQVIDSLKVGGAQKLVVVFTREMLRRGHEVEIISLSRQEVDSPILKDLQNLAVNITWIPLSHVADLKGLARLNREVRKAKADIIHTQLNYANILGTVSAQITGVPAVASLHNASVHLYKYRPYRTWLETWILGRYSKKIIACGYTVARVQQSRFGKKTLSVISNPVPDLPAVSKAQKDTTRKQFLPDGKGILVISVGRLIPEKGYSDLIRAIKRVNEQSKQFIKLLIVGEGYLLDDLKQEAARAGQQEFIQFLGERADVPLLLAASDIYVSTSHYEGQSLAVLEAMASALPVVVTDVGDNRIIISEKCGCVLPPGRMDLIAQELLRLSQNKGERDQLGRNASLFIKKNYSPAIWIEKLLAVYSEVLHG